MIWLVIRGWYKKGNSGDSIHIYCLPCLPRVVDQDQYVYCPRNLPLGKPKGIALIMDAIDRWIGRILGLLCIFLSITGILFGEFYIPNASRDGGISHPGTVTTRTIDVYVGNFIYFFIGIVALYSSRRITQPTKKRKKRKKAKR